MTPTKQRVYLPVNGRNDFIAGLNKKQGYFFTPEQLNQLLSDVIKDALSTAAENAILCYDPETDTGSLFDKKIVNKQSITNTFDITFQKHKV